MCEIIRAPAIAKAVGCTRQQVNYNIKFGVWNFGRTVKRGSKTFCISTISEVAKYLDISREEAVSYTHLDVYKRQKQRIRNGMGKFMNIRKNIR